jgi:hypothetical protein
MEKRKIRSQELKDTNKSNSTKFTIISPWAMLWCAPAFSRKHRSVSCKEPILRLSFLGLG